MMLVAAVAAAVAGFGYMLMMKKIRALPPRRGAAWTTLLKRMKYRGSRKQRSASRKILSAIQRPIRGLEKL